MAEQLLRGGIPAVRRPSTSRTPAPAPKGAPRCRPTPLLTMAEELLPRMTLAAWKDRAVAARNAGKDAPLREVRSVVAVGVHGDPRRRGPRAGDRRCATRSTPG